MKKVKRIIMFIVCISLVFGTAGCSKKTATYNSKKKTIKINALRQEVTFYNGVRVHNEIDGKNKVFKDNTMGQILSYSKERIEFICGGIEYSVDLKKGSNENQFTIEYYNDTYVKQK
ncbi:MAG: hypothetical protein HDT30_11605 [Clostridiales bacterium]|nr:hypothetical protein [Clostridiales bacterium]